MPQNLRVPYPTIVEELIAALAPHPRGLRRWSVMRVIRKSREALSREPAEYLALGFTGFVPKPVMVQGLIAAVTRAAGVTQPTLRLRRAG